HTALKIAPAYSGPVIWTKDASQAALMAARFMNPALADEAVEELRQNQECLRQQVATPTSQLSIEEARKKRLRLFD
ncbi:MAG: hypothetical protein SPE98_05875, partial [Bacteroidaceae bacterium]|nr:hypothetical protein [Bacteroidaceae bacterium]